MHASRTTPPKLFIALTFALALSGPVAVATTQAKSPTNTVFLVVTPPWRDTEAVIRAAGGAVVGPEQPAFGRLVRGDRVDFADRLWAEGAWLVLGDARILALCGGRAL